jgi:hypothetical protein
VIVDVLLLEVFDVELEQSPVAQLGTFCFFGHAHDASELIEVLRIVTLHKADTGSFAVTCALVLVNAIHIPVSFDVVSFGQNPKGFALKISLVCLCTELLYILGLHCF